MPMVETTKRESTGEQSSLVKGAYQTLTNKRSRSFRVWGVADDAAALAFSGIPRVNEAYPGSTTLVVRRVRATEIDKGRGAFEVTAEYEQVGVATAGEALPGAAWSWGYSLQEEPTFFDAANKQIALPSGEVPDQQVTRTYPIITLRYEFSSLTFTAGINFSHGGRVNAAAWNSFVVGNVPAKAAKFRGATAAIVPLSGSFYFRVTYEIEFRSQIVESQERGWQLCLLNAGFLKLDASNKLETIFVKGIPTKTPQLLSADGKSVLAAGATPNFLYKDIYQTADFSTLGIP